MSTRKFDLAATVQLSKLPVHLNEVDKALTKVVATDNLYLAKPIKRLLQSRGKRLRPGLVVTVAASQGHKIDDKVIDGAVAVELVHLASLVHDDIIDQSSTRRGIPTINSQEGVSQAIVVGDYLLAKGCQIAANISAGAAELVAATITKLCDGQALEMADQFDLDRSMDSYLRAINGKTAALLSTSCQLGAMCSNSNNEQIKAFVRFGEHFGMAYQVIDDVLDFTSTSEKSGKPVGNDVKEGVYTLPLLLALQKSPIIYAKLVKDNDQQKLIVKLKTNGYINQAMAIAKIHNQKAIRALNTFDNKILGLKNLPGTYLSWCLENLAS